MTVLLVGMVWLLALTQTIVLPVITAAVMAAVATPLVSGLGRHIPRAAAAGLLMLSIVVLAVGVVVLIVAGIASQSGDIGSELTDAKSSIEGWSRTSASTPPPRRTPRTAPAPRPAPR